MTGKMDRAENFLPTTAVNWINFGMGFLDLPDSRDASSSVLDRLTQFTTRHSPTSSSTPKRENVRLTAKGKAKEKIAATHSFDCDHRHTVVN
jgi:hypothetical protein